MADTAESDVSAKRAPATSSSPARQQEDLLPSHGFSDAVAPPMTIVPASAHVADPLTGPVPIEELSAHSAPQSSVTLSMASSQTNSQPVALQPLGSQPLVMQPPLSQLSVSQQPTSQLPVSQKQVPQLLVAQLPVSQLPASQPTVSHTMVSQPPVLQSPVSQPSAPEPMTLQPPVSNPPASDSTVSQPLASESPVSKLAKQSPITQLPGSQAHLVTFVPPSLQSLHSQQSVQLSNAASQTLQPPMLLHQIDSNTYDPLKADATSPSAPEQSPQPNETSQKSEANLEHRFNSGVQLPPTKRVAYTEVTHSDGAFSTERPVKQSSDGMEPPHVQQSPAKPEPVIAQVEAVPKAQTSNVEHTEPTSNTAKNEPMLDSTFQAKPEPTEQIATAPTQNGSIQQKTVASEQSQTANVTASGSDVHHQEGGNQRQSIVQHTTHPSRTQSAQPSAPITSPSAPRDSTSPQQWQPPGDAGPLPRNLPKNAKVRPKNARVFVGNLASEFTDPTEMMRIFYKYGELIEEPVLRRSFGFIQYATADAALRAVAGEQGRIIGGIPIDLSIADNREVKRGTHVANNTPFPHGPKGKVAHAPRGRGPIAPVNQMPPPTRKRRRSLSPGNGNQGRRIGGVHPPQFRRQRPEPRNGIFLRILCMSPTARNYAKQSEAMFRAETQLNCDIVQIVAVGLGDALAKCMREIIPYVLVVASKDVEDGTCTIRTLERTGYEKAGRGNGIISLREAIDVCLIDRGIPLGRAQASNQVAPSPPYNPQQNVQMVQAGWSQSNANNMGGGAQLPIVRKPGWMSGPRAPPHPQHQTQPRGGPIPPGGMPSQMMGGSVHNQLSSYAPQLQQNIPQHQMIMGGRPDNRMQYDRQSGYGNISAQQGQEYSAQVAAQAAWNAGAQPPAMSNIQQGSYGQSHQDYTRGNYAGPPQGMMAGRNSAVPSTRDNEYDPAAVMPSGGGAPQNSSFGAWNAQQDGYGRQMQQDGYGRQASPYNVSRQSSGASPTPGSRQREMGPAPIPVGRPVGNSSNAGYNTRQSQGGYRQDQSMPYGSDQGYPQIPAGYNASAIPGHGNRYGGAGYEPDGGRGYEPQRGANWGAGGNMQYDSRSQTQNYGSGNAISRHDVGGYMDPMNSAAQGGEWGSRRDSGAPHNNGARRDGMGNGSGGHVYGNNSNNNSMMGGRPASGYAAASSGQNGGDGGAAVGGPPAAPGGVDIGKLTNLISAFQQQQNMQQQGGSRLGRDGGNAPPGAGTPRTSGPAPLLTQPGAPSRNQNGHYQAFPQQNVAHAPPQMYQPQPPGQGSRNYYGR